MNIRLRRLGIVLFVILSGCASQQTISYQRDVAPILEAKCRECHLPPKGLGYLKSGLNMDSYKSLMEGTIYGPVVIPGDSRHSLMNMVVEGRLDTSIRVPHPLTEDEIATLQLWVDQGAKNN